MGSTGGREGVPVLINKAPLSGSRGGEQELGPHLMEGRGLPHFLNPAVGSLWTAGTPWGLFRRTQSEVGSEKHPRAPARPALHTWIFLSCLYFFRASCCF